MKSFIGTYIKRERLKKNYSQEGLCRGICVVSYLSKIEQGKAEAGDDIICALLERLGIAYETDEIFLKEAGRQIHRLYENLYEGILCKEDIAFLKEEKERYLASEYILDTMLFMSLFPESASGIDDELSEYTECMSQRQYELYLYLNCEETPEYLETLLKLNPNGFYLNGAGFYFWAKGEYVRAVEILNRAYQVSCDEGTVENMLSAQMALGNCYSSMEQQELMMRHYKTAERLARALGKNGELSTIFYNIASTLLEWNQAEEALEYFEKCTRKDAMYYHKYALCMERLGRKDKAIGMLKTGQGTEEVKKQPVYEEMYEVAEYRLKHEDYLEKPEYENLLRSCMKHMREQLPRGYEQFHVSYLMELLEHQRKYKEICQLTREFPVR